MSAVLSLDIPMVEYFLLAVIGGAATVEDLVRRSISNWISLAALVSGIGCQVIAGGWRGAGAAALGAAAGFSVFLVFYLLGGMGGGDVKLMAGFGSMLGAWRLLQAAFWIAITGGLIAAAVLGYSALRRVLAKQQENTGRVRAIPYAPAIVIGVWLTLLSGK